MARSPTRWRAMLAAGLATAAGLALGSPAVVAQPGPSGGDEQPRRVDEGFGDLTPFSLSFRVLQRDLRKPLGFEHVYELAPGQEVVARPPWATGTGHRFARQSGALTVVFPYSQYVTTKRGNAAVVPANSRFVIGSIPAPPAPEPRRPAFNTVFSAAGTGVDRRADRSAAGVRVGGAAGGGRPGVPVEAPVAMTPGEGMLTNEAYRQRRVRALLGEAARVGGGGEGGNTDR